MPLSLPANSVRNFEDQNVMPEGAVYKKSLLHYLLVVGAVSQVR